MFSRLARITSKIAKLAPLGWLFVAQAVGAQDAYGLRKSAEVAGLVNEETADIGIAERVGTIIGVALSLVGVIFLVLMVYGGFLWMTARGEAEQIKNAQTLIRNAIIGLIIVVAAYIITNFILTAVLTGEIS